MTLNPLFWPARHEETILVAAIYKFHPDFAGKVNVWWGDPTADHGLATLEGGDVMPIGKGNVLIGMGEHTSRQAISQLAAALFKKGAAERVIVAAMPKLRAAMHLDTVFAFADRDWVLLYPDIVYGITAFSYRPSDKPSGIVFNFDRAFNRLPAAPSNSSATVWSFGFNVGAQRRSVTRAHSPMRFSLSRRLHTSFRTNGTPASRWR